MGPTSFRKDYRILRPGATDHVRPVRSHGRARNSEGGFIAAPLPTATMPWWNGARLLNQNRGVFGLNLLSWWNRDGDIDRITRR